MGSSYSLVESGCRVISASRTEGKGNGVRFPLEKLKQEAAMPAVTLADARCLATIVTASLTGVRKGR